MESVFIVYCAGDITYPACVFGVYTNKDNAVKRLNEIALKYPHLEFYNVEMSLNTPLETDLEDLE